MGVSDAASVPSFVSSLDGQEAVKKALALEHPDYTSHVDHWEALIHAFEGSGGFLNGEYLWQYPREDTAEFTDRKVQARYHNHLESLVDIYSRFLFTQGVKRESQSPEYDAWTENVDGAGTPLTQLLRRQLSLGLVAGHAGVLVDKTPDEPTGPAKADDKGQVRASIFAATAIKDWRHNGTAELSAIKLREPAPETSIVEASADGEQYLFWVEDGWARFNDKGELVGGQELALGLVPFCVLRPKPSYTSLMLGRPLIPNSNVIKAFFNRCAEEDEVLRAQAFSVLTVSVGENGNVKQAKEDLGEVVGAAKALVVQGTIDYKTPDQQVPGAIRENAAYLIQEMYRAAHVRMKSESAQLESGQSIKLQYTELNEALQGIAAGLSQVERQIARAWFAWNYATPEQAQAAFEAAQVTAVYPSEFISNELMTELEAWAEAIRMNLGKTMTARIKKRAALRIEPDMPEDVKATVEQEIDAIADEPEPTLAQLDLGDPEAAALRAAGRAASVEA